MKKISKLLFIIMITTMLVGCSTFGNLEIHESEQELSVAASEEEEDTSVPVESVEESVSEMTNESIENLEEPEAINELEEVWILGEKYDYFVLMVSAEKPPEVLRWEISVYDDKEFIQKIEMKPDDALVPSFREMIREEDVNFDGVNDLLIHTGYYGVQGSQHYECYLADSEQNIFVWCQGFKDIPNPKVDADNQLICGRYRDNAVTYVDVFYQYTGSSFEFLRGDVYVYDEILGKHVYDYSYTKDDL